MKVFRLAQLVFSKAERGLWYDHDERNYDSGGWGIALRLFSGMMVRPITRPKYWLSSAVPSKWNSFNPEYHMLLKLWIPLAPFLSVSIGPMGFYVGFKVFGLSNPKYAPMVGDKHIFEGSEALTISVTTRTTRWK